MKTINCFLLLFSFHAVLAQNVGIGTNNPKARLHVAEGSVVFATSGTTPLNGGDPPVTGSGRRLLWYADKAAFRVGEVDGDDWDKANVGRWSVAGGQYCSAKGEGAVAFGTYCAAVGDGTVAIGNGSVTTGWNSITMGTDASASGHHSVAIGTYAEASGHFSMAIGAHVSTNNQNGALVLGDFSNTGMLTAAAPNTFRARFSGGYRFFTTTGTQISDPNVFLGAGQNAWSTGSSVYWKENFLPVDGEAFLQKIKSLPLTSWNYKKQDPKSFRHYGPMAQDFFAAFGHDGLGTVGNDSTINQADFDGVNLIAIQALEKRTADLREENKRLNARLQKLEAALLSRTKK